VWKKITPFHYRLNHSPLAGLTETYLDQHIRENVILSHDGKQLSQGRLQLIQYDQAGHIHLVHLLARLKGTHHRGTSSQTCYDIDARRGFAARSIIELTLGTAGWRFFLTAISLWWPAVIVLTSLQLTLREFLRCF